MTTEKVKLALFDFDGTLCAGDSIIPYLLYCIRNGICPPSQLFRAAAAFLRQRSHPGQTAMAKSVTLSFIRGRNQPELDELARSFIRQKLAPRFFADGVKRMRELKEKGYTVLLISASPEVYMRVMPDFLPVDAVLATPCLIDTAGRYTGDIPFNCRGEEKLNRLDAWLREHDLEADAALLEAYGDSSGDVPMLRRAGVPHLNHPSPKLSAQVPNAVILNWK